MAAVNEEGTNYAAAYSTINGRAMENATVHVTYDVWTMATQEAGSTFKVGWKMPIGAVPLFGIVLNSVTAGASVTVAIGDGDDADEWKTASTLTTTVPVVFGLSGTMFTELAAERTVTLTTAIASLAAAGTIAVAVFYALPY
jgi:hypothetical protein